MRSGKRVPGVPRTLPVASPICSSFCSKRGIVQYTTSYIAPVRWYIRSMVVAVCAHQSWITAAGRQVGLQRRGRVDHSLPNQARPKWWWWW